MDIFIDSSPDGLASDKRTAGFAGKAVLSIVGVLILTLFTATAAGASQDPPMGESPATAISQPTVKGSLSQPPAQPILKHKRVKLLKKKIKAPIIKRTKAKAENITTEISEALPERLETEIKKYFGLRYRMGGGGRNGIDCSTLTRKVYADVFGIDLPRNSTAQSRAKIMDIVADNDLQTGDLLFFGPRRKRVNHVGIYLAGGYFLHAARTEGVTISRLDNSYWKSRWMLSKRIKALPDDRAAVGGRELNSVLEQFSLGLALAGGTTSQNIHFLDSGIQVNNTSEFRLSAAYKETIDQPLLRPTGQSPLTLRQSASPVATESRLRLSVVFSPLPVEGFKLIPYVSQIVDNSHKAAPIDTQTLGLETWMVLPSSGVALFMAAHAKSREDLLQQPLKLTPDWRTLDFSLGVHYRFSNTLRFSLLSTLAYNPDFEENLGLERQSKSLDDISFKVNFQF